MLVISAYRSANRCGNLKVMAALPPPPLPKHPPPRRNKQTNKQIKKETKKTNKLSKQTNKAKGNKTK